MKIHVGVFFGGASVEHEVSIVSAVQAMGYIDPEKYHVIPLYFSKSGVLYTGDALKDIASYKNFSQLFDQCTAVSVIRADENTVQVVRVKSKPFTSNVLDTVDVAFPIVHGTNTEDGSLQGYFEMLRLPYVGCDVVSSAVGMDKAAAKYVMRGAGLPVLDFVTFYAKDYLVDTTAIISRIEIKCGYPVIVKPANLGSSIGIKKASDREELDKAIGYAAQFAGKILVERAITSLREINCAVLGDYQSATASLCEEPMGSEEILSFADKYMSDGSGAKGMSGATRKLPAELSPKEEETCKNLAVGAFKAVGCSGVSRVDLMIDTADNNTVYINEINTIPGSLAFYLFAPMGKSYQDLIGELIALAIKRDRERKNLFFSYDTNILENKQGMLKGIKK